MMVIMEKEGNIFVTKIIAEDVSYHIQYRKTSEKTAVLTTDVDIKKGQIVSVKI